MPNFSYGAATVGTSASLVVSANSNRKGVMIQNLGSVPIYIGFDDSVTTANGFEFLPKSGQVWEGIFDGWRGPVYAISGSIDQDVRYMEWGQ